MVLRKALIEGMDSAETEKCKYYSPGLGPPFCSAPPDSHPHVQQKVAMLTTNNKYMLLCYLMTKSSRKKASLRGVFRQFMCFSLDGGVCLVLQSQRVG